VQLNTLKYNALDSTITIYLRYPVFCHFCYPPEGEYAYNKRRTIVPLIVEYGYTPDGWLGPIVMNTLYFEFTNESKFDEKLEALIHEIQRRGECMKQSLQCSVIAPTYLYILNACVD